MMHKLMTACRYNDKTQYSTLDEQCSKHLYYNYDSYGIIKSDK